MGFAAGFQVGAQAVERGLKMREEDKLKRELAQAYAKPEEFTDYTPDQLKQIQGLQAAGNYEAGTGYNVEAIPGAGGQAPTLRYTAQPNARYYDDMGQPEAPIELAPQRVQRYGGQTVAGQFDPMQLQGLQMREAARAVGASGDPVRAAQMLAEATRMEREAVESPLRLEALRTQVAAGKLGLTKTEQDIESGTLTLAEKKRQDEAAKNMNNFNVSFGEANALAEAEGRTLTPRDIAALAKANKLSYSQENELIASQVNRTKAEVDQFRLEVEKTIQGKGFESLLDIHKNDKRFGDGVHFVPEVDKKTGGVVLARVNEATGRIEERMPFKTKAEATAYLREEAANPANAAIWLQNYRKGAASIAESEAGTKLKLAQAGAVGLEKLSPLEKNLNTLKRLNIPVTDAQIKTLVLGAQKDPALEAELAAITKIAGSDTANPKVLEALPGQIQAALARSKGRETATAIVNDLIKAQEDGKGAEAIADLRRRNMPEPALKAAAEAAGVTYTAPVQPTAAAATPSVGLRTTPAASAPPAGSRAAIAQEARAQATATQAETARLAAQAQSRLAADFATDARTLTSVELVRKYDKVRGQLPRDQALELQAIQRNIR